jgi:hypothetical protein
MPYRPTYDKGNWKAICDACGREFKATQLRKRWDGFMVCSGDWEPRQPQDFVRGVADFQAPPFTRPESSDTFIPFSYYSSFSDDPINVTESNAKTINKNIVNNIDANGLNDAILNAIALNATNITNDYGTETFALSESFIAVLGRTINESISIAETTSLAFATSANETISLGETSIFNDVESTSESVSFAETTAFSAATSLTDSLSISESTTLFLGSQTNINGAALNLFSIG